MNKQSLSSKQGASLTEFVILAPILVFLGYIAIDVNRRIEESQRVTIATRNTMQVNDRYSISDLNARVRSQLKEQSAVLDPGQKKFVRDAQETAQIDLNASNFANSYGIKAEVQDGEEVDYDRLAQDSNIKMLAANGERSSLNTFATSIGTITKAGSQAVSTIMASGSSIGLLIPDRIRRSTLTMKTAGGKNAIQKGISLLAEVTERDGGAKTDILGIDRQFAQRNYFRVEDGFHPNAFENSGLYAMGLSFVLDTDEWGYRGEFKQRSEYLQARCMTRFMSDNSCDPGTSYYVNGPQIGSFPTKILALATAKYAYSFIATIGFWVPVVGQAAKGLDLTISIAADVVLDQAQSHLEKSIQEDLVGRIETSMKSFAKDNQEQITNSGQSILNDMVGDFDLTVLNGILGE